MSTLDFLFTWIIIATLLWVAQSSGLMTGAQVAHLWNSAENMFASAHRDLNINVVQDLGQVVSGVLSSLSHGVDQGMQWMQANSKPQ